MKNTLIKSAILALALIAVGCSSDSEDDLTQDPTVSIQAVTDIAVSGSWTISSYVDSGTNETSDYTGYSFTFNADGSLIAENGSTTVTGTWSVTRDDSSDDDDYNSNDDIDFNIFFGPADFRGIIGRLGYCLQVICPN